MEEVVVEGVGGASISELLFAAYHQGIRVGVAKCATYDPATKTRVVLLHGQEASVADAMSVLDGEERSNWKQRTETPGVLVDQDGLAEFVRRLKSGYSSEPGKEVTTQEELERRARERAESAERARSAKNAKKRQERQRQRERRLEEIQRRRGKG